MARGGKRPGTGGYRPGAGRKPMHIDLKVRDAIKAALKNPDDIEKVWQRVVLMAKAGNPAHIKILFEYYYGKPKENLDTPTELKIIVVRK